MTLENLINELSADDWKEIQIALMEQMAAAIERPSDVNKNPRYYEKLSEKTERIHSHLYRKERGWN